MNAPRLEITAIVSVSLLLLISLNVVGQEPPALSLKTHIGRAPAPTAENPQPRGSIVPGTFPDSYLRHVTDAREEDQ